MKCLGCGHENREGAKFCNECAAPLPMPCPACGAPNQAGAKFCNECAAPLTGAPRTTSPAFKSPAPTPRSYTPKHLAEKILTSRTALEGERKQVTVLFADVQGSMALAEQVDPEKWHGILDRFFQDPFRRRSPLRGDRQRVSLRRDHGAVRGPIAHEDDAQRACYAALLLEDELRRYAEELK